MVPHSDEHFRRQAANDLRISWDQVDIELQTVTFSGLAKPHCFVCPSRYHSQSSCPSADPFRKSSKNGPVCFCFNRSSGCNSRSCPFPHVCLRCRSADHSTSRVPAVSLKLNVAPTDPPTRAIAARDKVQLQARNLDPSVSTPINIDVLAKGLSGHPDSNFVANLINSLRYGTPVGYLGPRKPRVSGILQSAAPYPDVVF